MHQHDWQAKVTAAQEAVATAGALLLQHAEGLGMLALMERSRTKSPDLRQESLTPSLYLHGNGAWDQLFAHAAEDAHWETVKAAIAFAGAREAQDQRWGPPSIQSFKLREAVEDAVGPDRRPPPMLNQIVELVARRHPSVKAEDVHRQAWRDYLMATTAGACGNAA